MGWTAKKRSERYRAFAKGTGEYIPGTISNKSYGERKIFDPSDDTKNRLNIIKEIEKRCDEGEKIEEVVEEISNREEIKEQFDYYTKNGITDLAKIFKNWFESYMKSKDNKSKIHLR